MGQLPKWAQECGKSRLHRTLLPLSKEGQIPPEVESRNLFNMNNLKESTRNRLHIDASRGVAGDMLLAALIDLGVPPEVVISPLSEALPAHSLEFVTESRRGIGGCRAMVESAEKSPPHRRLSDLLEALDHPILPLPVQQMAASVYRRTRRGRSQGPSIDRRGSSFSRGRGHRCAGRHHRNSTGTALARSDRDHRLGSAAGKWCGQGGTWNHPHPGSGSGGTAAWSSCLRRPRGSRIDHPHRCRSHHRHRGWILPRRRGQTDRPGLGYRNPGRSCRRPSQHGCA